MIEVNGSKSQVGKSTALSVFVALVLAVSGSGSDMGFMLSTRSLPLRGTSEFNSAFDFGEIKSETGTPVQNLRGDTASSAPRYSPNSCGRGLKL